MLKPPSLSTGIYWNLPGPRQLVERVADSARRSSGTVLSLSARDIPGQWDRITEGLESAHMSSVFVVDVSDGSDIAADVGAQLGERRLTGAQLARFSNGARRAVVLRSATEKADSRCQTYFKSFLSALDHASSRIHLVVALRDGELQRDGTSGLVQVLCFDGALTEDEMRAYVSQRMIGRTGPGSTRLLACLVTEYAGYDAQFAEQLMALDDAEILALPESLSAQLANDSMRWTRESWREGTRMTIQGRSLIHPLREWYLANHHGPRQKEMRTAASKRYWRACVHALMPWLEERRLAVLQKLRQPLEALAAKTGGKICRRLQSGETLEYEIDELEYNNVVGLARLEIDPLIVPVHAQSVLAVCRAAKAVRDDLAHLRKPDTAKIAGLIAAMDGILP